MTRRVVIIDTETAVTLKRYSKIPRYTALRARVSLQATTPFKQGSRS